MPNSSRARAHAASTTRLHTRRHAADVFRSEGRFLQNDRSSFWSVRRFDGLTLYYTRLGMPSPPRWAGVPARVETMGITSIGYNIFPLCPEPNLSFNVDLLSVP